MVPPSQNGTGVRDRWEKWTAVAEAPARLVEAVCRKSSRNGTGKDADAPQMYREQAVTSAAAVDRPSLGDLDSAHRHINLLALPPIGRA